VRPVRGKLVKAEALKLKRTTRSSGRVRKAMTKNVKRNHRLLDR
jgi:hypothetical protein